MRQKGQKAWSSDELARCAVLWSRGGLFLWQMAKEMGRSRDSISKKMRKNRVPRGSVPTPVRNFIMRDARFWMADEIKFLTTHWGKMTARAIGEHLGRNRCSVIGKAGRLHLSDAPVGRPLAAKPVVAPPAQPLPRPVDLTDFTRLICPCNNHNPCQPGRGLCASCLTKRQKPNSRASMWDGLGRVA